jgi:hypothetical protein
MAADLLEQMRRNPVGDWTIGDVEKVCRVHGLLFARARELRIVTLNTFRSRNIDHSGPKADQARLHSETCALY